MFPAKKEREKIIIIKKQTQTHRKENNDDMAQTMATQTFVRAFPQTGATATEQRLAGSRWYLFDVVSSTYYMLYTVRTTAKLSISADHIYLETLQYFLVLSNIRNKIVVISVVFFSLMTILH